MNTSVRNTFLIINALGVGVLLSQSALANDNPDEPARILAHATLEIYEDERPEMCDPEKTQVRITVDGSTGGGMLTLELYNDPGNFLSKKGRTRRVRVPSVVGSQTVCMTEPLIGRYAVAGYHDIDGNRKLKKKWNKTPREPFGLSNNPKIKELRFPKFSESAFELVPGGTNITIELVDLKKQKEERKAAKKAK